MIPQPCGTLEIIRIRRRELIVLLGVAATSWSAIVCAQRKAMPGIGVLSTGSAGRSSTFAPLTAAIRQGLSESGYVEGKNVAIEYRYQVP